MKVKGIQFFLGFFFMAPFLGLVFFSESSISINYSEFVWALKNSLFQSFSAALLSVILGYWGALGLFAVPEKYRAALQFFLKVPMMLPALFTILISLSLIKPFPIGLWGIVIVQGLIYTGFCTAVIFDEINQKMGNMTFVSEIYGIKKTLFYLRVLWPTLKRSLFYQFIVIFSACLTTLTIPLIVGGGMGTNLEVLIYEKVFIDQNWSIALGLSLVQLALVVVMSGPTWLHQNLHLKNQIEKSIKPTSILASKSGFIFVVFYLIAYLAGYLIQVSHLVKINYLSNILSEQLIVAIAQSFGFYILNILFFCILFVAILYVQFHKKSLLFLNFFLNPSSIIVGFALYLVFPLNSLFWDYIKLSLVFAIVVFVSFFKFILQDQMELFERQMFVARTYGLSFLKFIFRIYFPQIKKRLHLVLSLIFVLSISEYGLVKASGSSVKTLGVEMASYLTGYRLEGAYMISLIILALWAIVSFLWGVGLGSYKKP